MVLCPKLQTKAPQLVPSGKKNALSFKDRQMVLEVLCNNMPRPMKRDPTADHGWGYTRKAGKCHCHIVVCCVPPENTTVEVGPVPLHNPSLPVKPFCPMVQEVPMALKAKMDDFLGPGDMQVVVEASAMEETNVRPPKKIKPEKQVGHRAEKVAPPSAELEFGGLKQGFKQADRATYCLKDYRGEVTNPISPDTTLYTYPTM